MVLRRQKLVGLVAVGGVVAAAALVLTFYGGEKPVQESTSSRPTALHAAAPRNEEPDPLKAAIGAIKPADLRADLEKMYAESEYRPFWTQNRAGRKRFATVDAIGRSLSEQGLNPAFLNEAKNALLGAATPADRTSAEIRMSAAVLRAAKGQRFGFISADALGWNLTPDQAEVASTAGEAIYENSIADYFGSLKPRDPQFIALIDALRQYRQIAASGGWATIPEGTEIDFAKDTRLPALRARLAAEGYVEADASDEGLSEGVKLFQSRNGLAPDGRVGRRTLAALNVSVEERIGQLTANLERWRHMRHDAPADFVIANVADQTVAVVRGGREELRLRTVVGSPRHATPMLEARMTAVTLNPVWDIPTSIITNEIIPKVEEDPYYLEYSNMHVVGGSWDNPKSLRVRQRPGVGNSLGHMKFQMQNPWNIYLHDTPSRALFEKEERTFSHGCVRVQNPVGLAALLTGRSIDELNEGISAGGTTTIALDEPFPVFVLYWTVFTDRAGRLNFRRDAYDRDAKTLASLAEAGLFPPKAQVVEAGN